MRLDTGKCWCCAFSDLALTDVMESVNFNTYQLKTDSVDNNAETYKYLGCFVDAAERTLPEQLLVGGTWKPEECFQLV